MSVPETHASVNRTPVMPAIFYKNKPDRFVFDIPDSVKKQKWTAVVVFGDKDELKSACFPPTESDFLLSYPEKSVVYDRSKKMVERKLIADPLLEEVVHTNISECPQLTLLLRFPIGVADARDIKGVIALVIPASSVADLKHILRTEAMDSDAYGQLFKFANENKLAILAWDRGDLWNPGVNTEDLPRDEVRRYQAVFNGVADAWEGGVNDLFQKCGLPARNFLLWGYSGGGQWAHRLCLRKPDYFLAIHFHVSSSFDIPTPEASKVLWCLTTGELEPGYERSLRFLAECRKLGYPIIYKALIGIGHTPHPDSNLLGLEFFKYALTLKEEREAHDKLADDSLHLTKLGNQMQNPAPWPKSFQYPGYYGDIVNQVIYPSDKVGSISPGFRTPLPTKELAEA